MWPIWSYLLKKSLMEKFPFNCVGYATCSLTIKKQRAVIQLQQDILFLRSPNCVQQNTMICRCFETNYYFCGNVIQFIFWLPKKIIKPTHVEWWRSWNWTCYVRANYTLEKYEIHVVYTGWSEVMLRWRTQCGWYQQIVYSKQERLADCNHYFCYFTDWRYLCVALSCLFRY